MISKTVFKYCSEPVENIENYDKAIADNTQIWVCHHRDEIKILPSGIKVLRTVRELIENNRYYNCPANELIFLQRSEHKSLHNQNDPRCCINYSQKGKVRDTTFREKVRKTQSKKLRKLADDYVLYKNNGGKLKWNEFQKEMKNGKEES